MRVKRKACICLGLMALLGSTLGHSQADTILDFSEIPSGTLVVFSPYVYQGFTLTSDSGGFVFNSPDTGNGSSQTVGNNPFYAGANGLAAFSPATITLERTDGDPFSLLSIDLAANFAWDVSPTVTFTGTLASGGTISQICTVTTVPGFPGSFQTFAFTGFTDITSVSWEQASSNVHQFTNIHLGAAIPEPTSFILSALGVPLILAYRFRAGRVGE